MPVKVLKKKDNGLCWDMSMLAVLFVLSIYSSLVEGKADWYAKISTTKVTRQDAKDISDRKWRWGYVERREG